IPYALAISRDGKRLYAAGTVARAGGGADSAVVAYAAASGRRLWASLYHGRGRSAVEWMGQIAVDPKGRAVYVTGVSRGQGETRNRQARFRTPNLDWVTVAYDGATGRRLWVDDYDSPDHGADIGVAVQITPN